MWSNLTHACFTCYWLQYLLLLISCRLLICISLILNCFSVFASVSVADGIKTLTLMGKALMALHAYCLIFSSFKWVCLSIPQDFRALGSYCFHTLSCPIGMALIFQRDVRVCSISHALWQPHSEFWRALASDFLQKVVWNKQYKTRHTTQDDNT